MLARVALLHTTHMKLVVAYSHVDAKLALRLLVWVAHLGGVKAPVLVIATRRGANTRHHKTIARLLAAEFPNAEHRVLSSEDERGWPWSCSHLFVESLRLAQDDVFWLEPDCVPMRRGWFDELHAEYRRAGKTFMGALVPAMEDRCPDHMSGVAFYGRDWARAAPSIAESTTPRRGMLGAWDVDCAHEILRDFHRTDLVQHSWVRTFHDRSVKLASVLPRTAVYHQCKEGDLFEQIDPGFPRASLTQRWLPVTPSNDMTHYFFTENARVPLVLGGKSFRFEEVEFSVNTNSWSGIFATNVGTDVELLRDAADLGRIYEITEDDYAKLLAKKKTASGLITSVSLRNPLDALNQPRVEPAAEPAAPAKPAPADRQAVLTPRQTRSKK